MPRVSADALRAELVASLDAHAWQRDGLCLEYLHVEFFSEVGESAVPVKAVCRECLVRAECLECALEANIVHGVWGGLAPAERRRERREVRRSTSTVSLARNRAPKEPYRPRASCTACGGLLPRGREGLCCVCEAHVTA